MPVQTLKSFLDKKQVKYFSIVHSRAYTALEIAESAHVSGKMLAKTVVIKKDKQLAMVVLPAHHHVNFKQLYDLVGTEVHLAKESEFKNAFADCDVGAMPPFGNLYGMEVFFAKSLLEQSHIVFNAGSHAELIQLDLGDYMSLVKPELFDDRS